MVFLITNSLNIALTLCMVLTVSPTIKLYSNLPMMPLTQLGEVIGVCPLLPNGKNYINIVNGYG